MYIYVSVYMQTYFPVLLREINTSVMFLSHMLYLFYILIMWLDPNLV